MSSTIQVPGGFAAVVVLVAKTEEAAKRRDDGLVPTVSVYGLGPEEQEYAVVASAIHELVEDQVLLVEHLLDQEEEAGSESAPTPDGGGIVSGHGVAAVPKPNGKGQVDEGAAEDGEESTEGEDRS